MDKFCLFEEDHRLKCSQKAHFKCECGKYFCRNHDGIHRQVSFRCKSEPIYRKIDSDLKHQAVAQTQKKIKSLKTLLEISTDTVSRLIKKIFEIYEVKSASINEQIEYLESLLEYLIRDSFIPIEEKQNILQEAGCSYKIFNFSENELNNVIYNISTIINSPTLTELPISRILSSGDKNEKIKKLEDYHFYLEGISSEITALCVTSDSKYMITGCLDKKIKVWSCANLDQACVLKGHANTINAIVSTAKNEYVISGDEDGKIIIWDLTRKWKENDINNHTSGISDLAINFKYNCLISCGKDLKIVLWSLKYKEIMSVFKIHNKIINKIVVSSDFKHLITCSNDKTIKITSIFAPAVEENMYKFDSIVLNVLLSSDEKWIIANPKGKIVEIFRFDFHKKTDIIKLRHNDDIVSVNTLNNKVLTICSKGLLFVWSMIGEIEKKVRINAVDSSLINSLQNMIIICSRFEDSYIKILKSDCTEYCKKFSGHDKDILCIAFTPDLRFLLSGSNDGTVRVWSVEENKEIHVFYKIKGAKSIAITNDSKFAISLTADNYIIVLNLDIFQEHKTIRLEGSISDIAVESGNMVKVYFSSGNSIEVNVL